MGYQAKSLARYYQMKQHPVTPATRALWPWNRVIEDIVGGIDMVNGTQPHFLPVQAASGDNGSKETFLINYSSGNWASVNNTALLAPVKTGGAITISTWFNVQEIPASANRALVGMRLTGGGAAFNFPWTVDVRSDGKLRLYWQYATKQGAEVTSSQAVPLQTWIHMVATRDATGTAAELYFNGEPDAALTGLNPWSGGGSQNVMQFCNNGAGVAQLASLYSTRIEMQHTLAPEARAIYESARYEL